MNDFQRQQRANGACEVNRDLVLKMAADMYSLNDIARRIKTNSRHVRAFLDRNNIVRDYRKNYGGERSPRWKGGRHVTKRGYVYVLAPEHPHRVRGCYVLEHRLVMEKMIGRYLLREEVVHHINGVRNDNRPENLKLFSENREHLAHELKGRIPKWTESGLVRMRAGIEKSASQKRGKTGEGWHWRWKRKHGAQPSPQT